MGRIAAVMAALALALAPASCQGPDEVAPPTTVSDVAQLRQALAAAQPGSVVLLAPGTYEGGLYLEGLRGEEGRPVVIAGAAPDDPPVFVGGSSALHLVDPAYVELRDLVMTGATANGLNLDDGGSYDTPAHHVVLRRITVRDVGPEGNCDGIKLSGVDDFRLADCVVESWGDGGSSIDMVGCHRGLIAGCRFAHPTGGATGVQCKGGTAEVVIRGCRFEGAIARGVNIGGSTGLQYFRPPPQGYEAKEITVEGNVFVGAQAPVAFVGCDGATVRFNTIYRPGRWALRILQETREPGFVPCRNGVFTDNIVVYRSDQWSEGGVNIGPATAPETFRFARNVWYCEDRPTLGPTLPTAETDGLVGEDPLLADPEAGDFSLREGSPAEGRGHAALPDMPAAAEEAVP